MDSGRSLCRLTEPAWPAEGSVDWVGRSLASVSVRSPDELLEKRVDFRV